MYQMGKFEQEAKDLLQAIGGKENVTAVTHCATRMRFVLGDEKKANVKAIESIPAVYQFFTMISQPCLGLKGSQKKQLSLQPKAIKMPFNGL